MIGGVAQPARPGTLLNQGQIIPSKRFMKGRVIEENWPPKHICMPFLLCFVLFLFLFLLIFKCFATIQQSSKSHCGMVGYFCSDLTGLKPTWAPRPPCKRALRYILFSEKEVPLLLFAYDLKETSATPWSLWKMLSKMAYWGGLELIHSSLIQVCQAPSQSSSYH